MWDVQETIVAISSAPGAAVRGIVRVSGPNALPALDKVFTSAENWQTAERAQSVGGQFLLDDGVVLPVTALIWPDQRSYTRQPTVEIHTLGSTPILQQIVAALQRSGARLAQPGEFTLRAFLSGRLDLTQAEAVLAVIDAENQNQFDVALRQMAGGLAGPLGALRTQLLSTLAEVEAGLDFVEEDIQFISEDQMLSQLGACKSSLERVIEQISGRHADGDRPKVVLIGLPNSGKSSLFNRLTETDQAIVTDIAGTTTDYISAITALPQLSIDLIDTAGFEDPTGEISASAQQHRGQQESAADLRVLCIDASMVQAVAESSSIVSFVDSESSAAKWIQSRIQSLSPHDLVVLNKIDLLSESLQTNSDDLRLVTSQVESDQSRAGLPLISISSQTGFGLEQLSVQIAASLRRDGGDSVVGTTVQRASTSLLESAEALAAAINAASNQMGDEIVAAEIRESLNALGQVVGTVYTDDILDLVFGRFCIGK